jgi:hypothetical protein
MPSKAPTSSWVHNSSIKSRRSAGDQVKRCERRAKSRSDFSRRSLRHLNVLLSGRVCEVWRRKFGAEATLPSLGELKRRTMDSS